MVAGSGHMHMLKGRNPIPTQYYVQAGALAVTLGARLTL